MTIKKKSRKTLPGKVDKIIKPYTRNEPEKAQISLHDGDDLYREIRIENRLTDEHGNEVKLKENAPVDVTVEADEKDTTKKKGGG